MRTDWTDLPGEMREAIKAHTGMITRIEPAPTGHHADIASTLHTATGRVFVKAARKLPDIDGPEVRSLRWEAAINPHVTEFAPRLLWKEEAGGWLVLGFEHVEGRHADFSPGSPDLAILAKTVDALQATACPDLVNKRVERRWSSVTDNVTPMAGDALLHTDVNPGNLLITAERVYLVDWAFVSRGAAWVELGTLIPWLLKAGHTPRQAADWAAQFGSWADADPADIDLFSRAFADKWKINLNTNQEPWALEHAAAIQQWADFRLP